MATTNPFSTALAEVQALFGANFAKLAALAGAAEALYAKVSPYLSQVNWTEVEADLATLLKIPQTEIASIVQAVQDFAAVFKV